MTAESDATGSRECERRTTMTTSQTIDPTARELATLASDAAQLMLAAKKLTSALIYASTADPDAVARQLQSMICQAGYLMDECVRRVGGVPVYTSADGWTLPLFIADHD